MALYCRALSRALPSRAIRRVISVATEPVTSRPGPMVVARIAAHPRLQPGMNEADITPPTS
jgi:hypothetical protein